MTTTSPGVLRARAQDPFGAVEAYLAQAQSEIGRAFLELATTDKDATATTPGGGNGKTSQSLLQGLATQSVDLCPPSNGDLEQLSVWAERFARELDTVLSAQITTVVVATQVEEALVLSSEDSGHPDTPESLCQLVSANDPPQHPNKKLSTARFSSLPPRSVQETYNHKQCIRTYWSDGKRYRRRSWPPDSRHLQLEDRRLKRLLTRDASVQTHPQGVERYLEEEYTSLHSELTSKRTSGISMEKVCALCHDCAEKTVIGAFRPMSQQRVITDNETTDETENGNLVLPNQYVMTAKQAHKVQTSSLRNNFGATSKRSGTVPSQRSMRLQLECPNEAVLSDQWLQCILWKGSPYARIRQWKSDDEDMSPLEFKELPKAQLDQVDAPLDATMISSLVSRHELESFLRKVETSAYRPPSSLDGASLQDAVTQTSTDVSPSSSFTWVTEECDCSPGVTSSTRWRLSAGPGRSSSSSLLSSSSSSSTSTSPISSSSSSSTDSRELVIHITPTPLGSKSASAPVLRPQPQENSKQGTHLGVQGRAPLRAHSDKQLSELEAGEACVWLRAAGFPQYAQMYEDNQFPIEIGGVRKDHRFLDHDALYSLFRRLNTLNKCARLKNSSEGFPKKSAEESDNDDQCALSGNWQFQQSNRRWSRVVLPLPPSQADFAPSPPRTPAPCGAAHSEDSVFSDDHNDHILLVPTHSSPDSFRRQTTHCHHGGSTSSNRGGLLAVLPMDEAENCTECWDYSSSRLSPHDRSSDMLRRSGSERLKESARALLKRVESLKGKRKKNREVVIIGGPLGDDKATMLSSGGSRQALTPEGREFDGLAAELLSGCSTSMGGTPVVKHRKGIWLATSDNGCSFSDSECANTHNTLGVGERKRRNESGADGSSSSLEEPNNNVRRRPASFKRSQKEKDQSQQRRSFYDNVPVTKDDSKTAQTTDESESQGVNSDASQLGFQEAVDMASQHGQQLRRDSGVGASLTRQTSPPSSPSCWHCFVPLSMSNPPAPFLVGSPVSALGVYQCTLLRKLSFLRATTVADKHCPASRHANWNWGVTRLLKKMRTPDYKDKTVFGVPLTMVVQRNGGQSLPPPIQTALCFLHATALDAQGLFRKSGVRSRIQRLRLLCETHSELTSQQTMLANYEQQQSYDVADMVKQYFRELPESLLTGKQSEILINVYQHVPEDERLSALRMCILYLPDENREALQCLLHLLHQVSLNAEVNQMSASNLGVCLAPSIFQLGSSGPAVSPYSRSASSSPRRRRNTTREGSNNNTLGTGSANNVGMPDQRELDQSRAAHTCLTDMVQHYKVIFLVPEEAGSYQRLSGLDHAWEPLDLQEMGSQWQHFTEQALEEMLKECRDKSRVTNGWSSISLSVGSGPSPWEGVEVWQRKVGDGHPLKLYKTCVEVEAPPADILHRILRERSIWDTNFMEGKVLCHLDWQSDVFVYWISSLPPHALRQFCVIRTWRQERGCCMLVEASVEHPSAPKIAKFSTSQEDEEETDEEEASEATVVGGLVLASRYLLEPCGAGRTRVTHISRIDLRGRSLDWYSSFYGHLYASLMTRLRDSFKHGTTGPETKV